MCDRDLLELAAKAAGYAIAPHGRKDGNYVVLMSDDGDFIWNPLKDDGDALRLAAKLRLCISMNFDGITVNRGDYGAWIRTGVGSDDERCRAAVRIAIVRTAAAIGKDK